MIHIALKHIFTFYTLLLAFISSAQWSTDPANPMVLCNAVNEQGSLRVLGDGAGGWFTFWLDKRADPNNAQLFGQHLDAEGNALWTPNGKQILALAGENISHLAATRTAAGKILVAFIHQPSVYQDTLSVISVNASGNLVWPAPVKVTNAGPGLLGLEMLQLEPGPGGAYIAWYDIFIGGSTLINVSRINDSGALPLGTDGTAIPGASYGRFELHGDYAGGLFVAWATGNGIGAAVHAMRVDSMGVNQWPANVVLTAGSGTYTPWYSIPDGSGAYITTWGNATGTLLITRVDTSGAYTYSPVSLPICAASTQENKPRLFKYGNDLFVAWLDNRPPAANEDLYVQKLNNNGAAQWTLDGVQAIHLNTYIPTAGIVASDSGAVIVSMDATVPGYSAMRVRGDGTMAWPAPVAFVNNALNPFYERQSQHADGEGGVVSFWQSAAGDLYGARIYRNGELGNHVGISEPEDAGYITLYPNPASGSITITTLGRQLDRIVILAADGRHVLAQRTTVTGPVHMDVSSLIPGSYVVSGINDNGRFNARFVIQ